MTSQAVDRKSQPNWAWPLLSLASFMVPVLALIFLVSLETPVLYLREIVHSILGVQANSMRYGIVDIRPSFGAAAFISFVTFPGWVGFGMAAVLRKLGSRLQTRLKLIIWCASILVCLVALGVAVVVPFG